MTRFAASIVFGLSVLLLAPVGIAASMNVVYYAFRDACAPHSSAGHASGIEFLFGGAFGGGSFFTFVGFMLNGIIAGLCFKGIDWAWGARKRAYARHAMAFQSISGRSPPGWSRAWRIGIGLIAGALALIIVDIAWWIHRSRDARQFFHSNQDGTDCVSGYVNLEAKRISVRFCQANELQPREDGTFVLPGCGVSPLEIEPYDDGLDIIAERTGDTWTGFKGFYKREACLADLATRRGATPHQGQ